MGFGGCGCNSNIMFLLLILLLCGGGSTSGSCCSNPCGNDYGCGCNG
ncbi:MAG: hypothetical protein LBQ33_01890 [Oscillospiraceae bacterium]|nr:hypothetical protein [Oscillospiraceae bacterium]